MYLNGNKKKALEILDKEKEITVSQTMVISGFTAATICQVFMLLVFAVMVYFDEEKIKVLYFWNEFFLLEPIYRLLFSCAFFGLAAGILIKHW